MRLNMSSAKKMGQCVQAHIDGLAQDRSNSIAYALELLQSCIKP